MTLLKLALNGASGTAITTANSGFSLVSTVGSSTATFQSGAAFDGTAGARFVSDGANIAIANASLNAPATQAAFSVAIKIPSTFPAADFIVAAVYDTGGIRILQLIYKANGNVVTNDKSNVQVVVLTPAQAVQGTFFRFELVVSAISATAGAFTVRAYNSSNAQVGSTATSSTANTGTTAMNYLRVGALSVPVMTVDVDSVQTNDGSTAEIGRLTNSPPVVSAGSDQSALVGATVTLTGTATDADGTVASRLWSVDSGPTTPTITGATSNTASFVPGAAGTYVLRFTATDDTGASSFSTTTVTVTATRPSAPNVAGSIANNSSVIDARATTGGTALTYTISPATGTSQLTGGVFLVPSGATYTVTATDTYGQAGSNTFVVPAVTSATAVRTQRRVGGVWS